MSKKKRFSISPSLQAGLSETLNAVKNHGGAGRFEIIALNRIQPDPENPRDLRISVAEIQGEIDLTDPFYKEKVAEKESLQTLADTIQKKGVINPVVVYRYGDFYRLVAGERRYLASLLAGREDIQTKVLNEKPRTLDLRLLQWIENTEREDLSLKERIENVRTIVNAYLVEHPNIEITATLLKELIGISLSQATCYVAVLNAPQDLNHCITSGKINNLDKAAYIAKVSGENVRERLIAACIGGSNLKQLKNIVEQVNTLQKANFTSQLPKKRGRSAKKINLGYIHSPNPIRKIISCLLKQPEYSHYAKEFSHVEWHHFDQTAKAFQRLLLLLAQEGNA